MKICTCIILNSYCSFRHKRQVIAYFKNYVTKKKVMILFTLILYEQLNIVSTALLEKKQPDCDVSV